MGVGMVVITPPENADVIVLGADGSGVGAWVMGEIQPGSGDVILA